jgi:GcrA cell cycle regulator
MEWSEDLVTRLRDLWAEGLTTAEIGRRLGISKNAVVGKAHRLDLQGRPSPIRRDGAQSGPRRAATPRRVHGPTLPPLTAVAPIIAHPVAIHAAPAESAPVEADIVQATPERASAPVRRVAMAPALVSRAAATPRVAACCWPIGEPGTASFRFCDDAAMTGKPYCAAHAEIAYVRVRDRRSDAA